jgi:hypothetical protein
VSALGHGIRVASTATTTLPNDTEWWIVQWLPLAVAVIALGGVVWSNRKTSQNAKAEREDARERDYVTWRRGELQKLGSEVVKSARGIIDDYGKVASLVDQPLDQHNIGPIEQAARPIAADAEILLFHGAYEAAKWCIELHNVVTSVGLLKAVRLHQAALRQDRFGRRTYEQPSEARKTAEADLTEYLMQVQIGIRNFASAMEDELRLPEASGRRRSWFRRFTARGRGRPSSGSPSPAADRKRAAAARPAGVADS